MAKKSAIRFEPPQEGRTYYIDPREIWVDSNNLPQKLTKKNQNYLVKKTVYRFTYLEHGKRIRLKTSEHPVFFDKAQAEAWARSKTGIDQARKDRVRKRRDWESQYVDLAQYVNDFSDWYKQRAPNYYKTGTKFLLDYVIPYFVKTINQNNPNHWAEHFYEFKKHLSTTDQIRSKGRKLSVSSRNNIINALNNFLAYLREIRKYDPYLTVKCPVFPKKEVKLRDYKSVIELAEFLEVKKTAMTVITDQKDRDLFLDFYHVLYFTGMRFNELRSLTIDRLMKPEQGDFDKYPVLAGFAKTYGKIFFYISLESQIDWEMKEHQYKEHENGKKTIIMSRLGKTKDGFFIKKALKSKPEIGGNSTRTIPVWDKETAVIINERFKQLNIDHVNKSETLLFPAFQKGKLDKYLKEIYQRLEGKYTYKTWHCTRHSRTTFVVGDTGSSDLTKLFTGHQSDSFNHYNHIGSMLGRNKKDVPVNTGLLDLEDL